MPTAPLVEFIGITAAVLTTLCWLPQAIKAFREKETRAISLPTTATLALGIVLWLVYGLSIGDGPLIGANAVSLALVLTIMAMKLRYG
ncbi:MAG: SemiSWEET transporter [Pseudolabrys sp.]|nr:SemiSWEET transporter [Pseudolabrys sp.]